MDKETLIALTTDIVVAHVENNRVTPSDMPNLIRSIYDALANAAEPPSAKEAAPEPAVSIRASVRPNAITCLECGTTMKLLKKHIRAEHQMTPEAYKARWGLPPDYPLVAPNYRVTRRELALKLGFGRKPTTMARRRAPSKKAVGK